MTNNIAYAELARNEGVPLEVEIDGDMLPVITVSKADYDRIWDSLLPIDRIYKCSPLLLNGDWAHFVWNGRVFTKRNVD